jgi:hypothetical protein
MTIGPSRSKPCRLPRDLDAQPYCSYIHEVGEHLAIPVDVEERRGLNIEPQRNGANGHEECPCAQRKDSVYYEDVVRHAKTWPQGESSSGIASGEACIQAGGLGTGWDSYERQMLRAGFAMLL